MSTFILFGLRYKETGELLTFDTFPECGEWNSVKYDLSRSGGSGNPFDGENKVWLVNSREVAERARLGLDRKNKTSTYLFKNGDYGSYVFPETCYRPEDLEVVEIEVKVKI